MTVLSRRRWLQAALGCALAAAVGARARAAEEAAGPDLVVRGPIGPTSMPLVRLAETDASDNEAPRFGFRPWRTTEELEAALLSGQAQAAIMPTPLAAALYNAGTKLRLASIVSWGRLYVISTDPKVIDFEDLKGRTLIAPASNKFGELVFRYIAQKRRMPVGRNIKLRPVATAEEALGQILSRKARLVLADEPLATLAIVRGVESAIIVKRPIDLQAEWDDVTPRNRNLPEFGLVVTDALAEQRPDLVQALTHGVAQSATWVVGNPQPAARLGADVLELPPPVIELCLKWANLDVVPATTARPQVEYLFKALETVERGVVGGKLPDAKFYLPA
jgi:NitT/TauT family transport system substrate-binding protein